MTEVVKSERKFVKNNYDFVFTYIEFRMTGSPGQDM